MNAKLCLAKDEAKLQSRVFPSRTWEQDKGFFILVPTLCVTKFINAHSIKSQRDEADNGVADTNLSSL